MLTTSRTRKLKTTDVKILFVLVYSCLRGFFFSSNVKETEHFKLSSCMMDDDSVMTLACLTVGMKILNLSGIRVSSAGLGILGHVPKHKSLIRHDNG